MLVQKQMTSSDASSKDERKTVELCGDARDGRRCIRPHGHDGKHECHTTVSVHSWE